MQHIYQAFGLTLHANQPIPGLCRTDDSSAESVLAGRPTVRVELAGQSVRDDVLDSGSSWGKSWYESPRDRHGYRLRVQRRESDGSFLFSYSDGTRFVVASEGTKVWGGWPRTVTLADVATYLLGPIVGFVLRLRGSACLHASGVMVADRCIGILAPGGHGKSTTAAAFARLGHAVVTDDILVISETGETFEVEPGYPRLRLWPRAVAGLFGDQDVLPRIAPEHPTWDKRYLDLTTADFMFQRQAAPLAAIYSGVEDEMAEIPHIEAISGQEALLALLANSYAGYLLDRRMRAEEFEVLGRLAEMVPMRRFLIRRGVDRLEALCAAISNDCDGL